MRSTTTLSRLFIIGVFALMAALPGVARGADITVYASIPPVAELTSMVVGDAGKVHLIVDGNQSPHDFALRPKQMAGILEADALVINGLQLETFLDDVILRAQERWVTVVALADALPHDDLVAVSEAEPLSLSGSRTEKADGGHSHHHEGCNHGPIDPHVWLDPAYAAKMVDYLAAQLSDEFPRHQKAFKANAEQHIARLAELETELAATLAPLKETRVVTFHDAYRFLFARFGLPYPAVVKVAPEASTTPKELARLGKRIRKHDIKALFTEPQFDSSFVETLVEDHDLRKGTLDPLGAFSGDGEGYYTLLRQNVAELVAVAGGQ